MKPAVGGTRHESAAADDVMENSVAQVVTMRYSDQPHCYVLGKSSPIGGYYNNIVYMYMYMKGAETITTLYMHSQAQGMLKITNTFH